MAELQTLQGVLVAAVEEAYSGFTGRDGKVVEGGTRRKVWVATSFDSDPQEVRVSDARAFSALVEAGEGSIVRLVCELRASNDRIVRRLQSAEVQVPGDLVAETDG